MAASHNWWKFDLVIYYPCISSQSCRVGEVKRNPPPTRAAHPFRVDAIVILPDHLHTIWTLPDSDPDFSTRWKRIKASFSRNYPGCIIEDISESMHRKKEKGIWQRRFWEHVICDQADYNRHCDYIHYNPVKHGLVNSPLEWKYSSFRKFVEKGLYGQDWGRSVIKELLEMDLE